MELFGDEGKGAPRHTRRNRGWRVAGQRIKETATAGGQRVRDDRIAVACPTHVASLTNPRLVPVDVRVEDVHVRVLQRLRQRLDLLPGALTLHQFQQAEVEDYGIVRAARLPCVPQDLHVQPHLVRKAVTAVLVVPLVRANHGPQGTG